MQKREFIFGPFVEIVFPETFVLTLKTNFGKKIIT